MTFEVGATLVMIGLSANAAQAVAVQNGAREGAAVEATGALGQAAAPAPAVVKKRRGSPGSSASSESAAPLRLQAADAPVEAAPVEGDRPLEPVHILSTEVF